MLETSDEIKALCKISILQGNLDVNAKNSTFQCTVHPHFEKPNNTKESNAALNIYGKN